MITLNEYDKKVYDTELKGFLPDEFIDCHTHVWKDEFPWQGDSNGGATWPRRVASCLEVEELLNDYKTLFPQNKVTPVVFGSCSRDITLCNDYVREETKKFALPTLFRTSYDMTPDFIEEEVKKGGFLGLKPYLTNCPPYIPSAEIRIFDFLPKEHLEVADKHGWIVMLHIPRAKRLRDAVNVAQIMEIEEKYKNLKLIVAHIGRAYAKEDIGNAFDILKNSRNLVFDFTANVCDDAIRACIKAVGPKRLLFGSDLPIAFMRMYRIVENGEYINVIPRGLYGDVSGEKRMRESDEPDITLMIYEQILALKRVAAELKLTDGDVEDIMFLNSKRLIESVNP